MNCETKALSGCALDWAVAFSLHPSHDYLAVYFDPADGTPRMLADDWMEDDTFQPSVQPGRGAKLMQAHSIGATPSESGAWRGHTADGRTVEGSTMLEAAMRALVLQRLGDVVDVPPVPLDNMRRALASQARTFLALTAPEPDVVF